jgi:hypothetical protein
MSIQDFKAQVAGQMAIRDITSRFSATNGHRKFTSLASNYSFDGTYTGGIIKIYHLKLQHSKMITFNLKNTR